MSGMDIDVHGQMPSQHERVIARESARTLTALVSTGLGDFEFDIGEKSGVKHHITLPASAMKFLAEILTEIGNGNMVTIAPVHAELTTQEAAQILNVSRPYLVSLLEGGVINFSKVGTHRRVKYQDIMAYKHQNDIKRDEALDELAALSQEYDMGY